MKKLFLLMAAAVCTLGASAQHAEWDASSLKSFEDGIAAGYSTYWGIGYCLPDNYELFNASGVTAVIEKATVVHGGGKDYYGNVSGKYPMKLIMGMNNSTRDGVDPLMFIEGLANNDYVRTSNYSNEGVEYQYSDAIVKLTVAPEADGGAYGNVTLTTPRGDNMYALYVVDQTAKSGEGMNVVQTRIRIESAKDKYNTTRFGVEPGHTYYIMASEKGSVELYNIAFDACASDQYVPAVDASNFPAYWSAESLPSQADGLAAGYQNFWGIGYALPENYSLINAEGISASFE